MTNNAADNSAKTLDLMPPGTVCIITGVIARGQLGQRLLDMGIYPGLSVNVIRNAPLNDPLEIELDGYLVSMRHEEAKFVEVEQK